MYSVLCNVLDVFFFVRDALCVRCVKCVMRGMRSACFGVLLVWCVVFARAFILYDV